MKICCYNNKRGKRYEFIQYTVVPWIRRIRDHISCRMPEAVRRSYKKGEVILSEGSITENIGIVLSGMALISCSDIWGNASVLGNAAPGSVFAEVYACIPGQPMLASVTAAEDTSVLFMNVGSVLTTCTHACPFHTRLARNLLAVCAHKSLQLSQRIRHTSAKSIRGRLMSYFSDCAKRSGSNSFYIPYNRQQLAELPEC